MKRGAAGVALIAATRLLWQWSRPVEWSSGNPPQDWEETPMDNGRPSDE